MAKRGAGRDCTPSLGGKKVRLRANKVKIPLLKRCASTPKGFAPDTRGLGISPMKSRKVPVRQMDGCTLSAPST